MIKQWRLERFKSVRSETSLELAPLTVFAGPNSSGKSTVIQSILLTAQTIQSPVLNRPVLLNGHMARLGSFTDIVADADETQAVTVGFTIELDRRALFESRRGVAWRDARFLRLQGTEGPLEIDCDFTFSVRHAEEADLELVRLQPLLDAATLRVRGPQQDGVSEAKVSLSRTSSTIERRLADLRIAGNARRSPDAGLLAFEVGVMEYQSPQGRERHAPIEGELVGAGVRHFVPSHVAYAYDIVENEVRQVVDALTAEGVHSWRDIGSEAAGALEQAAVRSVINAVLTDFDEKQLDRAAAKAHKIPEAYRRHLIELTKRARGGDAHFLQELMLELPPVMRGELSQLFLERKEALTSAIRRGRRERIAIMSRPVPRQLAAGSAALERFFSASVEYLGPLRDEPKAVYPLSGATDPSDVGLRGQHTAAVLDVHRSTRVRVVEPAYFAEDTPAAPRLVSRTLLAATLDWLSYMGVGTGLATEDRGKLGHELKITIGEGGKPHDLTQVGVGVSQVLPILVLSFMAEEGATLIFEQPELHLHPRVQTRLADFFVALTLTGKQCIVETHSEYLINQLRYRAVVSQDDSISSLLGLYFVEKENQQSQYRSVKINAYGAIENWPRGFFDEKERTAAAIMKAAMAKRHRPRPEYP